VNLNDVRMRITADVAGALSALDAFSGKLNTFGNQAQTLGSSLGGVFNPLMSALTAGVAAVTAATAGLTKQMLDVGGGFELQMAIVQGKANASAEDLGRMSAKARELGETLPITATEAAQAMTNLTAAGAGVEGTLAAVADITKLSVVQNYDLARTSALVVETLRNFKMEWSEAGKVGDTFNHVFNNTALSIDQLAGGFQYISPLARHLNMSLEETVTVLGMLADAGLKGEQGATTLRAVMVNIIDAANKADSAAAKVFEELGVKLHDAQGNMRNGMDVLLDLSNTSMNAAQSFEIFGTRAFAGGLVAKEAFGQLGEKLKELEQDAGNVDRNLKLITATFLMLKKGIESAAEETTHIGFAQIETEAKSAAESIRGLILEFNSWARESEIFGKTLGTLFGEFNKGIPSVESFRASLKSIKVEDVVARFNDFVAGTKRLVAGLMDFANAVPWGLIIDNLGTIAQIIVVGWAAGKIAAVTAAIVGLSGAFDVLKTAVVGAGAAIAAHPILTALAATAAGIASIVDSANKIDEARAKIEEYNAEAERMEDIALAYTEALNGNLEALEILPKKYQDMANETLKARIETEKFQKAFDGVTDAALLATKAIFEAGLSSEEQVKQLSALWGDELADNFRRNGASAMGAFLSNFENMPADVRSVMVQVANSVLEGVEKVKDAVEDVPKATETVAGSLRSAAAEIQEYFVAASESVGELVNDGFLSAEQGVDSLKEQIGAKAEEVGKSLAEKFKNPALKDAVVNSMREIGKQSGNALFVEVADAMQKVEKTVKEFSDKAKTLLAEAFEEFDTLGVGVGNVLAETENFVGMVMESAGKSLVQIVNKTTGEIVATGSEAAQMMGSSIGDILRENQTLARTTGGMVAGEFNAAALQLQESARKAQAAAELAGGAIEKKLTEPMDRFANKSVQLVDDGMGNLKMVVVDAAEAGGSAITGKMIPPLEKTGETAKTTGAAIGGLAAEAVKVADGFKAAIDGIDNAISTMGERMVSALHSAVEGLKVVFEQIGIDSGNSMMTALNRQVEAAIPSLSTTAANAGMSMGQSMGRSLESAMQTSLQNIARAIDAMARRAASAVPAAAGSGGNVDAAALAAAYAREG